MEPDLTIEEPTPSRYVVGIDLGTTNSAVAFIDTDEQPWRIQTFRVPQLVAPGEVERQETLPSFHFEPAPGQFAAGALRLPWSCQEPSYAVGVLAREHGRLVPGRLIDSAKSWLCHSGVDRTAPLLPWHGAPEVQRLSPVEASARYLEHMRQAWDAQHPQHPLAQQDLVITLPASFDEVARQLTLAAARTAGLERVVFIEEPQAAFYAWIDAHRDDWEQHVAPGQKILICDVGGGTTDFTLIRVRRQNEKVQFHRVAVGQHLILGGDNFDLALAHDMEQRLAGDGKLEPRQWNVLVRTCRHIKELLLSADAPASTMLTLPGTGSQLIGGAQQIEVHRQAVCELLVDGFMPRVDLDAKPARWQSGFQEFGLPYASDPAITRHLAAFLTAHRGTEPDPDSVSSGHDPARPDIVLFNGGVFNSPILRERLLDVLTSWFQKDQPGWRPLVLTNPRLDLAVAQGAAYYGMVRRGCGVRIAAGLARTYYLDVDADPPSALCLVPAGVEPGQEIHHADRTFQLSLVEPVEFSLYTSSTRLTDKPGELVMIDQEQMSPLPPIRTVLRTRKRKDPTSALVKVHARLTEIGTLELWCSEVDGPRSWQLEFDVRSATQTDVQAHLGLAERYGVVEQEGVEHCRRLIRQAFERDESGSVSGLPQRMAEATGMSRSDWPPTLLRQIWQTLMEVQSGRRISQAHEARWLNLLGFSLRPGYGLAVDDWRVAETWRQLQGNLIHSTPMCRSEWWILWRRIAGGLSAAQQKALASSLVGLIRKKHQQMTTGRGQGADYAFSTHEEAEIWRMLGSLELVDVATKIELGRIVLDLFPKRKMEPLRPALAWTLGRLGARIPVYGPLNSVLPVATCHDWLERLMKYDFAEPMGLLAVVQLARHTSDRYRDIPSAVQQKTLDWLTAHEASDDFLKLVREGGQLGREEQELVIGESLPRGLRILQ